MKTLLVVEEGMMMMLVVVVLKVVEVKELMEIGTWHSMEIPSKFKNNYKT